MGKGHWFGLIAALILGARSLSEQKPLREWNLSQSLKHESQKCHKGALKI
jgi:hypothetical protein